MTKIQAPYTSGQMLTAKVTQIDGTLVENATEVTETDGWYEATYPTIANGFYKQILKSGSTVVRADTVTIDSGNSVNLITSEAQQISSGSGSGDATEAKQNQILASLVNLGGAEQQLQISIPGSNVITTPSNTPIYVKETGLVLVITSTVDISSIDMEIIFEKDGTTDFQTYDTVSNSTILTRVNDTTLNFLIPDVFTDEVHSMVYAIRDLVTKRVYGQGTFQTTYAPFKD